MRLTSLIAACTVFAGCAAFDATVPVDGVPVPTVGRSIPSLEPRPEDDFGAMPPLRMVKRPVDAAWLLDPVDVTYRDIEVRHLIERIAPGIPVMFDMKTRTPGTISEPPRDYGSYTILDHLNAICLQLDWSFDVRHDVLVFSDVETRSFSILAQPGQTSSKLSDNALGTTSEGDSGTSLDSDPYGTELSAMLEAMIEPDRTFDPRVGLDLLPSTNSVVVTARPSTVDRIADYIRDYNERTQIVVRVYLTIYEVQSSNREGIGADLLALNQGRTRNEFGFATRLLDPLGVFSVEFSDETSEWSGSSLLLEYLKSVGTATISLQDAVETRNNVIATSSSTRTFQYIKSIARQQDMLGREQIDVDVDELQTGWSIGVQPTAALNGVTVRFTLARRSLVEERPYTHGTVSGTTFVTDDFNRSMSVTLKDGETRLLTSLSTTEDTETRQSILGFLPTGSQKKRNQVEAVLLMKVELI